MVSWMQYQNRLLSKFETKSKTERTVEGTTEEHVTTLNVRKSKFNLFIFFLTTIYMKEP